jgi:hypothetical protein
MSEEKGMTPEEWEEEVKEKLVSYIENFVGIAKDCNMATKYFHPVIEKYETHEEVDDTKVNGVEMRILFSFIEDINTKDINFD